MGGNRFFQIRKIDRDDRQADKQPSAFSPLLLRTLDRVAIVPTHSRTFGESIRTPAPAPARFTFGSSYKTNFLWSEWWRIKPLTYHDWKLRRVSSCKELDVTEVHFV